MKKNGVLVTVVIKQQQTPVYTALGLKLIWLE